VADCFDALTTNRPYRAAFTFEKACEILRGNAERGDLDAKVVDALFAMLADGVIAPIAAARAA
jgi:HD-GYP domain-containing protein (c-di-GMP phosphodiesterase class II)